MRSTLRSVLCAVVVVLGVGALPPAATAGAGSLTGTVLDPAGAPFEQAEVLLTRDCGEEFCGTYHEVGPDGHYRIDALVPGEDYCARFYNGSDEQTYCFTASATAIVHDVVLARPAPQATVHGRVTNGTGTPVSGAKVWFSSTYDAETDASGRYAIAVPAGQHAVAVWLPADLASMVDVGVVSVAEGGDAEYDITLPSANKAPAGAITWSRGKNGRLAVGGRATDDSAVLKIRVAVQNRRTGKWLRPNGRWGEYAKLRAHIARSKKKTTKWRFSRALPRGDYGVSLVVIDTDRSRNPAPRPWRPVRVTR